MAQDTSEFYDEDGDLILPDNSGVKRVRTLGPFEGGENHILYGECPQGEYYAEVMSIRGSWNSTDWEDIAMWLEDHGFDTYLRQSSGSAQTRSGTAKSASTSLYYW